MFDVQNLYGTPQIPRKRPASQLQQRPRRMTLIDLRNVSGAGEEDVPIKKLQHQASMSKSDLPASQAKHGIMPIYDSMDNLDSRRSSTRSRVGRYSSLFDGSTRFPKLEECAHFHYDFVEVGPLKVILCSDQETYRHHSDESPDSKHLYTIQVTSNEKTWTVRRSYANFRMLDRQLHRCIFDRKFSHLPELTEDVEDSNKNYEDLFEVLQDYLQQFNEISTSMINCGSVLNWVEMDNRGNRLLAVDNSGINTPAIAAAHAVRRYNSQAADEISLEVGDIVSVIDMPPPEDTVWWRGKRGFEVGFFPNECVEVIGDTVPQSVSSRIPEPPVLRKQGKWINILRTFFSTRPARSELKQSGIVKERVFGCDLGEHLLNSGHDVPLVLKSCADVIEKHGIVDGIYRLSGISSNIQKLRLAFDEDRVPNLTDECYLQDIHSISSLLKMYFRELPNPLLTYQLYDKFADAVRDDENKLIRIHDIVQQLPPPHYRTTEYLIRHLARVAAFKSETAMHSKNIAIVWAPNLLRSKELEMGGGAAALQGVGIQAVVTEFLINYADLIFSDKMPSYSSPELRKSQKKPRPKSLAISTPTKLLSLEEARERAANCAPQQKYIDVGGGPDSLPQKYHTVIDKPGYRKKGKESAIEKSKKSPSTRWKSIFSKSRSNSIKSKTRKPSLHDTVSLGQGKALTEEDVHNWKRRLRSAKSAESLLSAVGSPGRNGHTSRIPRNGEMGKVVNIYGDEQLSHHKRSLSSDASRVLANYYDPAVFKESGDREVGIDVEMTDNGFDDWSDDNESINPQSPTRQSFIRGDNTRRAIVHRKTSSAPSTPVQETKSICVEAAQQKEASKESLHGKGKTRHEKSIRITHERASNENLTDLDFPINLFLCDEDETFARASVDTSAIGCTYDDELHIKQSSKPPKGHSKQLERTVPSPSSGDVIQLAESPGARRKKHASGGCSISSEWREGVSQSRPVGSYHHSASPGRYERPHHSASPSRQNPPTKCEPRSSISPLDQHLYSRYHDYAEIYSDEESHSQDSINIRNEYYPHVYERHEDEKRLPVANEVDTMHISSTHATAAPVYSSIQPRADQLTSNQSRVDQLASTIASLEQDISPLLHPSTKMSKCLSVPSDIQTSLESVNLGSQSDLLSVTISELSQSRESFSLNIDDELAASLWRSKSMEGIDIPPSPFSQSLCEMNAQIDRAFKRKMEESKSNDDSSPQDSKRLARVAQTLEDPVSMLPTDDLGTPISEHQPGLVESGGNESQSLQLNSNASKSDFDYKNYEPKFLNLAKDHNSSHCQDLSFSSSYEYQNLSVTENVNSTIFSPIHRSIPDSEGHTARLIRAPQLPPECQSLDNEVKSNALSHQPPDSAMDHHESYDYSHQPPDSATDHHESYDYSPATTVTTTTHHESNAYCPQAPVTDHHELYDYSSPTPIKTITHEEANISSPQGLVTTITNLDFDPKLYSADYDFAVDPSTELHRDSVIYPDVLDPRRQVLPVKACETTACVTKPLNQQMSAAMDSMMEHSVIRPCSLPVTASIYVVSGSNGDNDDVRRYSTASSSSTASRGDPSLDSSSDESASPISPDNEDIFSPISIPNLPIGNDNSALPKLTAQEISIIARSTSTESANQMWYKDTTISANVASPITDISRTPGACKTWPDDGPMSRSWTCTVKAMDTAEPSIRLGQRSNTMEHLSVDLLADSVEEQGFPEQRSLEASHTAALEPHVVMDQYTYACDSEQTVVSGEAMTDSLSSNEQLIEQSRYLTRVARAMLSSDSESELNSSVEYPCLYMDKSPLFDMENEQCCIQNSENSAKEMAQLLRVPKPDKNIKSCSDDSSGHRVPSPFDPPATLPVSSSPYSPTELIRETHPVHVVHSHPVDKALATGIGQRERNNANLATGISQQEGHNAHLNSESHSVAIPSPSSIVLPVQSSSHSGKHSPEILPPTTDVVIVSRPSFSKTKHDRPQLTSEDKHSLITVHDFSSERGEAKLIIERRPSFKKIVRAQKIDPPILQRAETVPDSKRSSFQSDRLIPQPCNMNEKKQSSSSVKQKLLPTSQFLDDLAASNRQSLDESILQVATERFNACNAMSHEIAECSGESSSVSSVKVSQSSNLRNLRELFECRNKSGANNSHEDSLLKHQTIDERKENITPTYGQDFCNSGKSSYRNISKSRDEGKDTEIAVIAVKGNGPDGSIVDPVGHAVRCSGRQPLPRLPRSSRPPLPKPRTHSDSTAASPAENTKCMTDDVFGSNADVAKEMPVAASRRSVQLDVDTEPTFSELKESMKRSGSELKRKVSIKELREIFESQAKAAPDDTSSACQMRRANLRMKSVSPNPSRGDMASRSQIINVRHSFELTGNLSISHQDGMMKPQAMRLGPMPFYGAKN